MAEEKQNIVIIGGGIIGACSAYYITRHPNYDPTKHSITLLEASKIAGGASGKAGGLLALWAYPSNIVPLSYRLHAELSKEHNGESKWGYRKIHCGQLDAKARPLTTEAQRKRLANGAPENGITSGANVSLQKRSEKAKGLITAAGFPADLDWIALDSARGYEEMGAPDTTAQVHPFHFTSTIASLAEAAGVKIELGARATSVNPSSSPSSPAVESVAYTKDNKFHTIPASSVVLAAGPWTQRLLPSAPISGLRAHSVTIRPTREVSPYALFTSISLPTTFNPDTSTRAKEVAPEIYARPNREVYACGEGDTLVALPDSTADVVTDERRCQDIIEYVGSVSDELRDGEITARQACYLPVVDGSGGPFIGEVGEMRGLVLAAGHSCWGIQNGPGTGKLVSEIVMEGRAVSAKLGNLDPKRGM